MVTNIIKNLLKRAQVTRATAFGVINVGWSCISGPITGLLILMRFTPETQGFYYTFYSVLALQMFVELGFSNIVTYFSSHEWAKLSLDSNGKIVGDADALSRLVSLGRAVFKWYLVGAGIIAVGLSAGGYLFFTHSKLTNINWQMQWIVLCMLCSFNFILMPFFSLLEGCNQVAHTYFFRMVAAVLISVAGWIAIFFGASLWSLSVCSAVGALWSLMYLSFRYRKFFLTFFTYKIGSRINWWREIWQVQWRTAITYIGVYFSMQVFVPILFHFHGPVIAGQFGMTWTLAFAVARVSGMWAAPRGPQFAILIAKKDYHTLDQLLSRITFATIFVMFLGAVAAWLIVYFLYLYKVSFATRLLSPLPTALLLCGTIIANVLYPTQVYLRAHKREPYVVYSIVGGLIIGASALMLGRSFSALGISLAFLVCNLFIVFPWELGIFLQCRKQWHN